MEATTRSAVTVEASASRLPAPRGRRPAGAARWRRRQAWITAVAGAVIVVLTYFPLIFVLSNSLKSGQNIISNGVFALFNQFDTSNYSLAWSGVSHQLLNTIIVAAVSIVIGVTAAALGAYSFAQLRFRGKNVLFLAYVALLLIPWTLTLIPLFLTIQKLHFFNTWWALILPYAAGSQPLLVLIFRGFFEQIPRDLLESARVDGCSERQVLARIVVPLTRPVLLTGAILVMNTVWGDYLWPTVVIQDPAKITISAGVQQFIGGLGQNTADSGAVFAAFVIAILPMFCLIGLTMRYFVSGLTEGATKL